MIIKKMTKTIKYTFSLMFISLIICVLLVSCHREEIKVDLLITHGIVYTGLDNEPHYIDIGITRDTIIWMGNESEVNITAIRKIDATDMIVCPGFIDPHTHAESDIKDPKLSHNLPFLMQGVTTVVVGNDGSSPYPISKYKSLYAENGLGTNVIMLTGHGTLRAEVIGTTDRPATDADLLAMQNLQKKEMEDGSFGMSTGLFYAPGSYGDTHEVIALAKIVAAHDGIYDTHLRDESNFSIGLIPSIQEAIEIGRQAKIPIHISHIKCLGVDVWHQSDSIIHIIETARSEGIDMTANQYPYEASATGLQSAVIPRWAESGGKDSLFYRYHSSFKDQILRETEENIRRRGGPKKLLIVNCEDSTFVGKTLLDIAEEMSLSPAQATFEILKTGSVKVASFNMNEDDISAFMRQPWVMTGSDGGSGHPRKYGTFPRKYNKYVREEKIIDLPTFINNSTANTANIFKIPNRGIIKKGYFADIIIFDPETFRDRADYNDAYRYAEGLKYSIINGKLSIDNAQYTDQLNGEVLSK